jgi:hypothetical protein
MLLYLVYTHMRLDDPINPLTGLNRGVYFVKVGSKVYKVVR